MNIKFEVVANEGGDLAFQIECALRKHYDSIPRGDQRYSVEINSLGDGRKLEPGMAPDWGGTPGPGFDDD